MTLAWHYLDEVSADHDVILAKTLAEPVFVPRHWLTEVGNALVVGERGGRATVDASAHLIERLMAMTIIADDRDIDDVVTSAMALARTHRLTVYDSVYLDLARVQRVPLATLDHALAKTARALGVVVLGAPA